MQVFPGDDFGVDAIEGWLVELETQGLLLRYECDGREYIAVTGWHHQKIERPTNKYPAPPRPEKFDEQSTSIRRAIDDRSPPEWNGMEWNGREKNREKEKGSDDLLLGTVLDSPEFRDAWRLCCAHLGANADRGLNLAWEQATLAELARRGYEKALADVRFTLTIANARNVCDSNQSPRGSPPRSPAEAKDDFSAFIAKNLNKGKSK
jgi:hypothetical protein